VNPALLILYLYVFPVMALVSTAVLVILWFLLPGSAKTLLKARVKRSGSLVFLANDDGYTRVELMSETPGMGILKGNPTSYVFTPRPTYVGVGDGDEQQIGIPEDERAVLDELILHRQFMDVGKPVYFGYVGKSVAVTPRFLEAMKTVKRRRLRGEEESEFRRLQLLDPRVIKTYMPWTFNQSLIDTLTFAHERMAELRKPLRGALKVAIPITAILIIVLIAYMLLQGGGLSFFQVK